MDREDVPLQRSNLGFQALELETVFLGSLRQTLPAKVRGHGAVDLYAGGEVAVDDFGGEPVGIGPLGDRGPRDKHGGKVEGHQGRGKAGIRP